MDQACKTLRQYFISLTHTEAVLVVQAKDYNRTTHNTMPTDDILHFWEVQIQSFMLSLLSNNTVGEVSEQCPEATV